MNKRTYISVNEIRPNPLRLLPSLQIRLTHTITRKTPRRLQNLHSSNLKRVSFPCRASQSRRRPLHRLRSAAVNQRCQSLVQRNRSEAGVASRQAREALVLRSGSTVGFVDGAALGNGSVDFLSLAWAIEVVGVSTVVEIW
jgi:hypothetical protein